LSTFNFETQEAKVSLQKVQKRKRKAVVWFLVGFLIVQLGLAVGLETCWPAIRDPDFDELQRIVRARQAEAPDRPLVLAVGSSRTQMGLNAKRLNQPTDGAAPLVINCGIQGGGPMMHQIVLRRLFQVGVRPRLVFVEVMPLHLSARDGPSVEERQKLGARYTAGEVSDLWGYYEQPYRLWVPWMMGRLLPCYRHQAEFRNALGIDIAAGESRIRTFRDEYGWIACCKTFSPEEVESQTRLTLAQYRSALIQPAVAPGAKKALSDAVKICLDRNIPVVLIAPPEGSALRSYAPEVAETQMNAVRGLAHDLGVPLIDARNWVDDEGFWDGHHTTQTGANQYTERFGREALEPYLGQGSGPIAMAAAPSRLVVP
jgi:hypothetical protein